ncbi:MAG: penicillin-binding protein 2 [Bacteroidales bacterium]
MRNKYELENRRWFIAAGVLFVALIFIARLAYLQIIEENYKSYADSNAFLKKTIYPSRGLMYDRNGELLVYNQPAYDIMLVFREIKNLDTLDFCNTLNISKEQFDKRMAQLKNRKLNPGYSAYTPQVFMNQLSAQEYGILQEKLHRFPGFYIQSRTLRQYSFNTAAHLFGSLGEVNQKDLQEDPYYVSGDYSGRSGIERFYENQLRGEKGVEILLRDAHGRIKGRYENGQHDIPPVSGKDLTLSIDVELQRYGEMLMQNKLGSIVAIEPSTGEVLAMISAPSFDPSIMVGRQRGANLVELQNNDDRPLFDRPLMAAYPPGSTFKTAQGLAFLQEGIITPSTTYPCHGGYYYGSKKLGCHAHASPLGLAASIQNSCNAYYCFGLKAMLENRNNHPTIQDGMDKWRDYMVSMGFGYKLGIDLPSEYRGLIPNSGFYDKRYGKRGWRANTIISISIGQGEVLATPLQICNLAATIANRGFFYTPHVVKKIGEEAPDSTYTDRRYTMVDSKHYDPIVEGMYLAVNSDYGGTARIGRMREIELCGKTGTAQNPHGKDHSIFMGFAPKDNPKIAIAVYIENAGFGATYAVPIASLMVEKYLNDSISNERKWMEENMLKTKITKSGITTN